jgi:hypothetical protein
VDERRVSAYKKQKEKRRKKNNEPETLLIYYELLKFVFVLIIGYSFLV